MIASTWDLLRILSCNWPNDRRYFKFHEYSQQPYNNRRLMVRKVYIFVKKHEHWSMCIVWRCMSDQKFKFLAPFTVQVLFRIFMGPQVVATMALVFDIIIIRSDRVLSCQREARVLVRSIIMTSTVYIQLRHLTSHSMVMISGRVKASSLKNIPVFWKALQVVSCPRSKRRW